jgi:hypothetical protein
MEKIGKVSKKFPKIGFLFLPFSQNISNLKIVYLEVHTSFLRTTHNYSYKSLIRLNFTLIHEPVY